MFARVAPYSGDSEELVRGFDRSLEQLAKLEGFSHAYFGVDREIALTAYGSLRLALRGTEATPAISAAEKPFTRRELRVQAARRAPHSGAHESPRRR